MKTITTIEYNHGDILEVKSTFKQDEANELLATGKWVIMHAGLAHEDHMGFKASPCYVLARIK
jgi:hydrogenase maturation factor